MLKRKVISGFFSALMFIFFINNLPEVSLPNNVGNATQTGVIKAPATIHKDDMTVSKLAHVKTHVKVRYMGSECKFQPEITYGTPVATAFSQRQLAVLNNNLTSSIGHFLFKLRGPPATLLS